MGGFVPLSTPGDTSLLLLNVEYLRHEVFSTIRWESGPNEEWAWNVTEGNELAARKGGAIAFDPAEMGITPGHILSRYPSLDIPYALSRADLTKPVLFVPCFEVVDGKRQETALLVDGWHRMMRSVVESTASGETRLLMAHFLTADEAHSVRITPEDEDTTRVPALPATLLLRDLSRRVKRQTGSAFPGK